MIANHQEPIYISSTDYKVLEQDLWLEVQAAYHNCFVPIASGDIVQCDPRGVYWHMNSSFTEQIIGQVPDFVVLPPEHLPSVSEPSTLALALVAMLAYILIKKFRKG